jgi:trk system potassium uptake protein TrkH
MRIKNGLTTIQLLALGFILIILLGTSLLMQPFSHTGPSKFSFTDALFTATSAVTTTGLGVVDTGSYFSVPGQLIILILIQIGGIGYMIFLSMVMAGIRKRLSFRGISLLHESMGRPAAEEILKFSRKVLLFTLFFELTGALVLAVYWSKFLPKGEAIYSGLFHSVSAFCTAGFALFPDGFVSFRNSIYFNIIIILLSIAGSVGFYVLNDTYVYGKQLIRKRFPRGFSVHTRLAVYIMILLLIVGSVITFITPGNTLSTHVKERGMDAVFQVVSASTTTGFNTVNIGTLASPVLWILIILMFIGSCPGSTGGGIKTTTFGIVLLSVRSMFKGRQDINLFRRSAPPEMIMKAYSLVIIAFMWIAIAMCIMLITERGFNLQSILFEITSAFGTVGLSAGITSGLSMAGKYVIILTMLLGRLGPVAVGYSLIGNNLPEIFTYPKAEILIG